MRKVHRRNETIATAGRSAGDVAGLGSVAVHTAGSLCVAALVDQVTEERVLPVGAVRRLLARHLGVDRREVRGLRPGLGDPLEAGERGLALLDVGSGGVEIRLQRGQVSAGVSRLDRIRNVVHTNDGLVECRLCGLDTVMHL